MQPVYVGVEGEEPVLNATSVCGGGGGGASAQANHKHKSKGYSALVLVPDPVHHNSRWIKSWMD